MVYVPLPVRPDRLPDAIRGLPALGFRGANVTVPHKQNVMPYLDSLTLAAAAIGAVKIGFKIFQLFETQGCHAVCKRPQSIGYLFDTIIFT